MIPMESFKKKMVDQKLKDEKDREIIRKLSRRRMKLYKKLQSYSNDPQKAESVKKKISSVEKHIKKLKDKMAVKV